MFNELLSGRYVDEAIRILDALRFTEECGGVCPANWIKGDEAMTPAAEGIDIYLAGNAWQRYASCKMALSPELCIMPEILSAEYYVHACDKFFRMPCYRTKFLLLQEARMIAPFAV